MSEEPVIDPVDCAEWIIRTAKEDDEITLPHAAGRVVSVAYLALTAEVERLRAEKAKLVAACETALMACEVYQGQSPLIDEAMRHLTAALAPPPPET